MVHLILIRFRLTQQKVVSEELENVQAAHPAAFMEVLLESLSLNSPDCLTFSKWAKHFHFFVPLRLLPKLECPSLLPPSLPFDPTPPNPMQPLSPL